MFRRIVQVRVVAHSRVVDALSLPTDLRQRRNSEKAAQPANPRSMARPGRERPPGKRIEKVLMSTYFQKRSMKGVFTSVETCRK
jgi:hypothetical protein